MRSLNDGLMLQARFRDLGDWWGEYSPVGLSEGLRVGNRPNLHSFFMFMGEFSR